MRKVRALFLSDFHLGKRGCRVDKIQGLLNQVEAEYIYLVGDIFDMWYVTTHRWDNKHDLVVTTVLDKAKASKVFYLPGNHDSFWRRYLYTSIGNVRVLDDAVHRGLNGKYYLVIHGDKFDEQMIKSHRVLHWIAKIEHSLNFDMWTASIRFFKPRIDRYVEAFKWSALQYAAVQHCDGIICGHTHVPEVYFDNAMAMSYMNCGDFVHNASALVETLEGDFELWHV